MPAGCSAGTDIVSREKSVRLLGIHLNTCKIQSLSLYISVIYNFASNQLNTWDDWKKS